MTIMSIPSPQSASRAQGPHLIWLRRDLRLTDHTALHHAMGHGARVAFGFVFDTDILQPLLQQGAKADRRLTFIHQSLCGLDQALRRMGSALLVEHGRAADCIPRLVARIGARAVYASRDYEPGAVQRDAEVAGLLAATGVEFHGVHDQILLQPDALLTSQGKPYSVFTPYKNAWLKRVRPEDLAPRGTALQPHQLLPVVAPQPLPGLDELGFEAAALPAGLPAGTSGAEALFADFLPRMDAYAQARDYPAIRGTSYLSVHLRFGTISVRALAREAWQRAQAGSQGAATWLSELIWRDFYAQILHHHPQVVDHAFKPEYDRIAWDDAPALYAAWCEGRTGYPLVDAALRQLNATGYMHNRLRMVTASFFTKDLGLDWRLGERYFALKLNDYDLSANNGGWQWAASTGCDAQPYFRIFNPVAQSERFDPKGRFIRRYVPELAGLSDADIHAPWSAPLLALQQAGVQLGVDYPLPVVDHAQARARTLRRYAVVKDKSPS